MAFRPKSSGLLFWKIKIKKGADPDFEQTNTEFWQNAIPAKEDKKQLPKLAARANKTNIGVETHSTCRDRPRFFNKLRIALKNCKSDKVLPNPNKTLS